MSDRSFDKTVRKLCNKKITDPDEPILCGTFTVEQAIAAAIIRKAIGGASDSVKLIREILDDGKSVAGSFKVDINVVE